MTRPAPRFYLVTNDAARAALILWCHPGNLPPSIAVVADPSDYARVPDGAKCDAHFWGTRAVVESFRALWMERVERGGILGIGIDEWEKIRHWVEHNRRRPALTLLHGATFEDAPEPVRQPAPSQPSIPRKPVAEVFL